MGIRTARTPDGRRLEVDRVVAADAEDVWDLLVDTERWPDWGPSVSAVETDGGERRLRPDTTGRVRVGGVRVPFAVDALAGAPEYRWTWRVASVPATGHRVEALPNGRCRVVFEVPLLAAGYAVVCERALGHIERLLEEDEEGEEGEGGEGRDRNGGREGGAGR